MFRFANPHLLWLLLLPAAAVVIHMLAAVMRRRRLARFGNMATLRELMPEVSTARNHFKFLLFIIAMILIAVAAARPQFGSKLREEKSRGVEMMLVVDVSNSMLAEDFEPSRLERTKYAIDKLFDGLKQERVGVIVFAGEAKVQLPITSDYRMAKAFAKRISPTLVAEQGTSIGKALSMAMMSFSSQSDNSRVMILITDGETHDNNALEVAQQAAEQGIKIFTIGIGTPEGAPISINGEYISDENGEMVVSKLNEQMLQEIASTTGGAYVRASKQSIGLEEIVKAINEMQQDELLHRVCFLYRDADGHDYYLFRENPEKPIGFLLSEKAGMPLTQDEQMTLDKRELEEMLDTLRQSVYPKDRSKWTAADYIVAMNRMRNILGSLVESLGAIQRQPRERKMDCFYLLMQVELALVLALGGIEAEDLPNGDTLPMLDSAYITALATQFQSRLEEQATLAK